MVAQREVYVAPEVHAVRALYHGLTDEASWLRAPSDQLRAQADRLAEGHRHHWSGAEVELANWHPRLRARPGDQIWAAHLEQADFRLTLAIEHGFPDWAAVTGHPVRPSAAFEAAVEALLAGDLIALGDLVRTHPGLPTARSHWGHRATLLHYVAANGVETHRQRVPRNAAEVARLLVARGADPAATADMYGGGQTPLSLLLTSSHPLHAGVTGAVAAVLRAAERGRTAEDSGPVGA